MIGLCLGLLLLAASPEYPGRLPPGLPSLSGGEFITGTTQAGRVRYAFWVDPERLLLYRLTWYRVRNHAGPWGRAREVLVWNAHPGERQPLECYQRIGSRTWRTLWLIRRQRWTELDSSTDAYRNEMFTATHLYFVHQSPAP